MFFFFPSCSHLIVVDGMIKTKELQSFKEGKAMFLVVGYEEVTKPLIQPRDMAASTKCSLGSCRHLSSSKD